ncbi:MAG: protein kinase [Elusimicrobia bacterium]|nr:protein kinase [Elusimicrobiota bacterium]
MMRARVPSILACAVLAAAGASFADAARLIDSDAGIHDSQAEPGKPPPREADGELKDVDSRSEVPRRGDEGGPILGGKLRESPGRDGAIPALGAAPRPEVFGLASAAPLPVTTRLAANGEPPPEDWQERPAALLRSEPQHAPSAVLAAEPADRIRRLLGEAEVSRRSKDWGGALQKAREALKLADNDSAYMIAAEAGLKLRRYEDAARDAEAATTLSPGKGAAYHLLARARLQLNQYGPARDAALRAVELHPGDGRKWLNLGRIQRLLGEREEAAKSFAQALDVDSKLLAAVEKARAGILPREGDDEMVGGVVNDGKDILDRVHAADPFLKFMLVSVLILAGMAGAGWLYVRRFPDRGPVLALRAEAPAPSASMGLLAGKYETVRVIGRGGMGDVLEARDQTLGRTVAVKRMSTHLAEVGAQGRDLMIQEARTVAALHHPAIVDVYEIIEDGEALYLVFEFIRGKTVQQMLAESRRLSLERCVEILKPVCQALDFAHSRGVVHRDLKPSNIMVTEQGYPKLMDFGIARRLADGRAGAAGAAPAPAPAAANGLDFVRTRTIVGTPLYMAPETEQGIVCKESDVFSLGVCLYEMATGERPFAEPATAFQKIQMDFLKPSARVPALGPAFDEVVLAALQPSPEKRLHSAKDFLQRLRAVLRPVAAS